ncbi:hypothetical protein NX059_006496 [Plenodomus lindquistii]|nr:hypothetical protein NX059_006496 [Plenodomus lindquistii]
MSNNDSITDGSLPSGPRGRKQTTKHKKQPHSLSRESSPGNKPSESLLSPTTSSKAAFRVSNTELSDLNAVSEYAGAARKSVKLPISNTMSDMASQEVKAAETDFSNLLYTYGYTAVIDAAFTGSQKAKHPFRKSKDHGLQDLHTWRTQGAQILADIPMIVLTSLLDGTLCGRVHEKKQHPVLYDHFDDSTYERYVQHGDSQLKAKVHSWVLRSKDTFSPAIYVRIIADAAGLSPTPAELRIVISKMRMYVSGDVSYGKDCAAIDNHSHPNVSDERNIHRGEHAFLQGVEQRVQNVLTFCEALEDVLDEEAPANSPQSSKPYPRALKYIGYSVNAPKRGKEHDCGTTDFLKSLFYAICKVEFSDIKGVQKYDWHMYAVAYPAAVEDCQLGEELLSRLTHSYYYTGLGFNVQPAGLSINSGELDAATPSEFRAQWDIRRKWREEKSRTFWTQLQMDMDTKVPVYTKFAQNERVRKTKRANLIKKRDKLLQEIAQLESETLPEQAITDKMDLLIAAQSECLDACGPDERSLRKALTDSYERKNRALDALRKREYSGVD